MPDLPPPVGPTINDQFWFDYSKDLILKASASRNEAGAKLQTLLAWLWGIYTAGATIGVVLSKSNYPLFVHLLIISPSVVLILAYWVATWVQMPTEAQFDPRIPDDICSSYLVGVKKKGRRLNLAISFSFLGALLVPLALICVSMNNHPPNLNLQLIKASDHQSPLMLIGGEFPPNSLVMIQVDGWSSQNILMLSKDSLIMLSKSGELQTRMVIDTSIIRCLVTTSWIETDSVHHTLSRSLFLKNNK